MEYYLVVGERSGDLHAANLMKALKRKDPKATFRFWGGDAMQAVGGEMVKHYREMAFMGFIEVLQNLRTIRKFLKECQSDIETHQPDVVILVDYSGFNMRIAKYIHKKQLNTSVYYYISPKIWAWNTKRAYNIKKLIDRMFVIFPFEVDFYKQFEYEVDFVGNPLWDALRDFNPNPDFKAKNQLDDKPIIALLPGSRKQEVTQILGKMLEIREEFPSYQWVVAGVSNLPKEYYAPYEALPQVKVVFEQTYDLLTHAEAAVVTSGTATLETALLDVPQVVVYRTSLLTYWIVKALIKVKYISLVNLVAEKEAVRELIQNDFSKDELTQSLEDILLQGKKRSQTLADYKEMKIKLGKEGASESIAGLIVNYLIQDLSKKP